VWGGKYSKEENNNFYMREKFNREVLSVLGLESEGESTLSTVLTILVGSHVNSGSALLSRALSLHSLDLSVCLDFIVVKDGEFGFLSFLLSLQWGLEVFFLLFLLSSSSESEDQVEGGFLLDVIVSEGSVVLELLSCKSSLRH